MKYEPTFILKENRYYKAGCFTDNVEIERYSDEVKVASGRSLKKPKQKTVTTQICNLVSKANEEQSDKEYLEKQRERDKEKRKKNEINPLYNLDKELLNDEASKQKSKPITLYIRSKDKSPQKASDEPRDTLDKDIEEYNNCGNLIHGKDGRWVSPDKENGSLTYPDKAGCDGGKQYKRVGRKKAGNKTPCGRRDREKCKD
jgi:hypothetical protein